MIQIDHAAYQKKVKTLTETQLRYIIHDATEAIKIYPENEKNGYYADEINYCAQELHRRAKS